MKKIGKLSYWFKRYPRVAVLGWGDYRVRLDLRLPVLVEGWVVEKSRLKAWKIIREGVFTSSHYYFDREWIH